MSVISLSEGEVHGYADPNYLEALISISRFPALQTISECSLGYVFNYISS